MDASRILDADFGKYVSIVKLALLRNRKFSLLPEIYEIFGEEATIKFLDLFSGQTIKVPSARELEKIFREVTVYIRLNSASSEDFPKIVEELSAEYLLDERMIIQSYEIIKSVVEHKYWFKKHIERLDKDAKN